jgi:hypothetical protein
MKQVFANLVYESVRGLSATLLKNNEHDPQGALIMGVVERNSLKLPI